MKPKLSDWQPLDLIDREAVTPLRSFNSRSAIGDHRYYSLDQENNAVCVTDSEDELDNRSESSEVEFLCANPIEDEATKVSRRRWQKVLMIFVFTVILITCLVVVIVVQHARGVQMEAERVCTTPDCVTSAAYILNKMDQSVNPCDNFYQFSCGNWVKNTPVPPSKSKYGAFQKIAEEIETILKDLMDMAPETYKGVKSTAIHKTSAYYNMCMDETEIQSLGVEPVLKLIKEIGSWPLTSDETSGTFNPDTWNIQDAILLTHQRGFSPLLYVGVGVDSKNNSEYIIEVEQSGLTLSDSKEYFPNDTKYESLKDAFFGFSKGFVELLGAKDNVDDQIKDLYAFEQKLALIQVTREEIMDPVKSYNRMTLKKFQEQYLGDWFNMHQYINGIYREIRPIPDSIEVIVSTPAYFTNLQKVIAETDERTLANYIVWQTIQGLGGYLTKDFLDVSIILDKAESGIKEYDARWKRCLAKTKTILGFALSALYIEKNFADENKREVESLFEAIRSTFIRNLDSVDWMDPKTRDYAKRKAAAITKMLGYPEFLVDPAKLDKHYENLTLVKGKLFESKMAVIRYLKVKNLRKLGRTPDRTEWDMFPTEVNAYYSIAFNQIVFPAGILRAPLFNMDKPKSFNFGSFGMICGHELTHGFDNKGKSFDIEGNMNNWWSNSSKHSFENKTQCFIDFYDKYEENGTHLNGELTLSENIADNGGMKTAYYAYEHWMASNKGEDSFKLPGINYSPNQLFFIGMAQLWCSHYTPEYLQKAILTDVHSIAKYRVLASMSNSHKFAEAYNCPKNSPMNPEQKCSVW